jgi:glutathione S-transferase
VRLALEEKGVAYELVPVDIFAVDGPPSEHVTRHPFGKIPAFEHTGFCLYEAGAITRYIDEAFGGPPLQPADPRNRARMNQIISILDSYAYRTCRAIPRRRAPGSTYIRRNSIASGETRSGPNVPTSLSFSIATQKPPLRWL